MSFHGIVLAVGDELPAGAIGWPLSSVYVLRQLRCCVLSVGEWTESLSAAAEATTSSADRRSPARHLVTLGQVLCQQRGAGLLQCFHCRWVIHSTLHTWTLSLCWEGARVMMHSTQMLSHHNTLRQNCKTRSNPVKRKKCYCSLYSYFTSLETVCNWTHHKLLEQQRALNKLAEPMLPHSVPIMLLFLTDYKPGLPRLNLARKRTCNFLIGW